MLHKQTTFAGCLPSLLRLSIILQFLIPLNAAALLPMATLPMGDDPGVWGRQILSYIYSV